MIMHVWGLHPLYQLAGVISLVALLMRHQLSLRWLLLLSYAAAVSNNLFGDPQPSYEAAFWNGLNFVINFYVFVELLYGRTTLLFSARDRELYRQVGDLTPGEFRKLMRSGTCRSADGEATIIDEGAELDKLFFVYEGAIIISKAGRETPLNPRSFVGEIAFLNRSAASASVRLAARSRWIEWPAPALRRQIERDAGLRTVIMRLIGEDLARKVARA